MGCIVAENHCLLSPGTVSWHARTRGEVDIITVFGTVVPGSSPGGCTIVNRPTLPYNGGLAPIV